MSKTTVFKFLLTSLCLVVVITPFFAAAQGDVPNRDLGRNIRGSGGNFCEIGSLRVPCFMTGDGPAGEQTFGGLVTAVINILILVVGSISVLFLIIGGFRYVTAAGNEENAEGAKKTMLHAIIGLVVVIMSFAIIAIVSSIIAEGAL